MFHIQLLFNRLQKYNFALKHPNEMPFKNLVTCYSANFQLFK
jgi:hypothetical protein